MSTATIDLAPITDETRRAAERWLKASDGGAIGYHGYKITDLLPTVITRVDRIAEVLAYAQSEIRGKFKMMYWHHGPAIVKKESSPPPLPCGTTACLAGTAAAFYMPVGFKLEGSIIRGLDGRLFAGTREVGRDELGLTTTQANVLFYMTNARFPTIQRVASLMTGRELTGDLSHLLPEMTA